MHQHYFHHTFCHTHPPYYISRHLTIKSNHCPFFISSLKNLLTMKHIRVSIRTSCGRKSLHDFIFFSKITKIKVCIYIYIRSHTLYKGNNKVCHEHNLKTGHTFYDKNIPSRFSYFQNNTTITAGNRCFTNQFCTCIAWALTGYR